MIGEIAYDKKPGGRRLGTIVGQRTVPNAQGVPTGQWEIRTAGGIRFFMSKADVRTSSEPEPEPGLSEPGEPAGEAVAPPVVPAVAQAADVLQGQIDADRIAEGDRGVRETAARRRSVLPVVVTLFGVVLCVASGVLYALGYPGKLSETYGAVIGAIPGLIGLLIILIGTNLVGEQAKRLAQPRRKEAQTRSREGPR